MNMVLRFHNTLTKRKEVFRTLKKGLVTMYNCGPTVYDYAHIGNFKTYMFADLLRRYLEFKGYKVKQVMNITDVGHMTEDDIADAVGEDKIEKKAREARKSPKEIAEFYTRSFLDDWKKLNMKEPMARPLATDYVNDMIGVIKRLIKNGHAYESNGSVYFSVPSFSRYGRLSGNTIKQLKAGAGGRVEDNPDKKNPLDFALWVRNPKHIMQWDSPWGRGYPGWHIECSAMSMRLLGESIDIHTGGEDNIFPHHDCEIAQSECANKKPFVRYWMHARHLKIDGRKMSKSLGNFYRLDDLLNKGYSPEAVRYLLISAQYRTKLNMTEKSLKAAEITVKKIKEFVQSMASHTSGDKPAKDNKKIDGYIKTAKEAFERSMDDDLGIPDALASVFRFMTRVNRERDSGRLSSRDASKAYGFMIDIDRVLGLGLDKLPTKERIPNEIMLLVKEREDLRKKRDFKGADNIRDQIRKRGFVLEDTPEGPIVKRS
jgi:cysteinyl-tRNA synthetase